MLCASAPRHVQAPVIETERLRLRAHQPEHLRDCTAMWRDEAVTRYTGGPSTSHRSWMRLLSYRGHWSVLGFGYWAVEERTTARYVGDIGFADFRRDLDASLDGLPELGWALATHAHGKGYATEALRAAMAWGDEMFATDRVVCIISPHNAASLRVAEKLGFRETRRTEKDGEPQILFARRKGD
jgi:RimJ/RimL family protein N-acetyltransferase